MADKITEAYRATDGTIFVTQSECEAYELRRLKQQTPMFTIDINNNNEYNLIQVQDITNVKFILLLDESTKTTFVSLRTTKYQTDYPEDENLGNQSKDQKYTVAGLKNETSLGLFALKHEDNNEWTWIPLADYLTELANLQDMGQKAGARARLQYISK